MSAGDGANINLFEKRMDVGEEKDKKQMEISHKGHRWNAKGARWAFVRS